MDALLALIPAKYLAYVTAAVTVCAVVCTVLPAPKATTGWYYTLYQIVNWIALNFGHARNLSAPSSAGIVGGPTAISNPQVSTASVPKP